jgi:hypothetical protein
VTPDGWSAALAFLLFVAPGIVWDLLSRRREAEADESAFREASRVALFSLVFSLPAAVVVVLVSTQVHRVTRVVGRLASGDVVPLSWDGLVILVVMLTQLALACLFAYVTHRVLMLSSQSSDIDLISGWTRAFRHDRPDNHDAYVRAKLINGSVWTGRVVSYSSDFELEDRELVLGPPLSSRGPSGNQLIPLEPHCQRVILRGNQIASLVVEYHHRSRAAAEGEAVSRDDRSKVESGKPNGNGDRQGTTEASHAGVQARP